MKFEVKSSLFFKTLQQVGKSRSKVVDQGILNHIHVEVEDHALTIRATNLELFCEKTVPIKGIQNGVCILPGDFITKIAGALSGSEESLVCECIDGLFTIATTTRVFEIKTVVYEDFPKLPHQGEEVLTIEAHTLIEQIKAVAFAGATTDIKPDISTVYMYGKEGVSFFVATDSYRLAESITEKGTLHREYSFLIPHKKIQDVLAICIHEQGEMVISKSDHIISITINNMTLVVHTVLGTFPDYRQLFPKTFTTTIQAPKQELLKALQTSTYFAEQFTTMHLYSKKETNSLVVESKNESIGTSTATITTDHQGDDIDAKYNTNYCLESFPYLEGEKITIQATTSNRPLFIQGNENANYTYLLMPFNR